MPHSNPCRSIASLRPLIPLWTLLLLVAPSIRAQVSQSDSMALVALYQNTNGPGWIDRSGWLSDRYHPGSALP